MLLQMWPTFQWQETWHRWKESDRDSARHQFAATRTTCFWSCWQSLGSDPPYSIAGTIPPSTGDLPWWTFGIVAAHCAGGLAIGIHCVRTSLWAPSEISPFCWALVSLLSTSTIVMYIIIDHHRQNWPCKDQRPVICWQVCGAHGGWDEAQEILWSWLLTGWHNFFEARGPEGRDSVRGFSYVHQWHYPKVNIAKAVAVQNLVHFIKGLIF